MKTTINVNVIFENKDDTKAIEMLHAALAAAGIDYIIEDMWED